QAQILFVEQPHDDFFAIQRGDRGNTKVEFLLFAVLYVLNHDAAVLRQPLFADVQLSHDFDTAGDGIAQFQGRLHDVLQHAVDAKPSTIFFFVGFDVNVTSAPLDGVGQNQVDQLNDRRLVRGLLQRSQVHLGFFGSNLKFRTLVAGEVFHYLVEFL